MVAVSFWGSLSTAVGGNKEVDVEAKDIRELFRKLEERYPDFKRLLDQGIAVSIDGVIYRDTWSKELPTDGEIYLLPRLAGG